jgi:cell division protein FtsL
MLVRGRYVIAVWTVVFVAAVVVIIRRDHNGWAARRAIDDTEKNIRKLQGLREVYEGQIANLSSPEVLQPKAEALGLHITSDSDFIQLSIPAPH